jgi:DNA-directed RNA polymerase specialized sigma24 family protein
VSLVNLVIDADCPRVEPPRSMSREAYGDAYQQGFKRTVRLLLSRGATQHYAEDLAQSAWLKGWEKLHQLRDTGTISSWINTIAINHHRRGGPNEARYQVLFELSGDVGVASDPLDTAKILTLCSPPDRILFQQQLRGLTTNEMARKHGISVTAIRIRLLRARRALRASIAKRTVELRLAYSRM